MGDAPENDVLRLLREAESRSQLTRNVEACLQTLKDRREENSVVRQAAADELRILVRSLADFPHSLNCSIADTVIHCLNCRNEPPLLVQTFLHIVSNLLLDTQVLSHYLCQKNLIITLTTRASTFFDSPPHIKCQCVATLSLIAECCAECCSQVLSSSFTTVFNCMKSEPANERQMLAYVVAMHTMLRPDAGGPTVNNPNEFVDTLMHVYHRYTIPDIKSNIIYSLMQWLSLNPTKEYADIVMAYPRILETLMEFFQKSQKDEGVAVLRILGHLIYADDDHVSAILATDIVTAIRRKINTYSIRMKVETFWFLSNVIAVRDNTIAQYFIEQTTDLWDAFIRGAYARSYKLRREAMFCIINALSTLDESYLNRALHDFFAKLIVDVFQDFTDTPNKVKYVVEKALLTFIRERLEVNSAGMRDAAISLNFLDAIESKINGYVHHNNTLIVSDTSEYNAMLEAIEEGEKCLEALRRLEVNTEQLIGGPDGDNGMEVDDIDFDLSSLNSSGNADQGERFSSTDIKILLDLD